jgi:hypothetical protein
MAGTYPDYPSNRMAYDRDGTQVFKIDTSNSITGVSAGNIAILNNENNDNYSMGSGNSGATLCFIFPELRDIDAYCYIHSTSQSANTVQVATSVDTTNGIDGTWVNLGSSFVPAGGRQSVPYYRNDITTGTAAAVKSIRFYLAPQSGKNPDIATLHLFGKPSAGQNPNRLILWHPTLDQRVGAAYFDWGDVRRSSAATDRTFRVKNNSSTLTANGVACSFDVLSDASPTLLAGQHSLSLDGTTFTNTVTIGTLAPGAISGTVTVRRTIASTAALSVWALRVVSTATSWT